MRYLPIALLLLLAACGGGDKTLKPGEKPRVMATTVHLASLAMAICGEDATIEMLAPEGTSMHSYEPSVADRRRIQEAHLLLVNGLEFESFDAAKVAADANAKLVDCSAGIPEAFFIEGEEEDEEGHHDHEHHGHGAHNPHVWLSTEGALHQARAIVDALAAFDGTHAEGYRKRFGELKKRLEALRDEFKPKVAALKKKTFVSNHDAFPYFAREFGLEQVGVIQRSPGRDPTVEERHEIELLLARGDAHAIFMEPGFDDKASREIAANAKLPLATLDPFDVGKPAPDALEKTLRANLETVLKTLGD
jgi:ABC-type Zn uptake system ZnuABC Zn-binding protein ZnuA